MRLTCLVLSLLATLGSAAAEQTKRPKAAQSDVIYGRKFGMALTMEVFTAATVNGIGVVWVVSSSGRSGRDQTLQDSFERRSIVDFMQKRDGRVDPSFQFYDVDAKTGARRSITAREEVIQMLQAYSPVTHVSAGDPPTILIHGDQDKAVLYAY